MENPSTAPNIPLSEIKEPTIPLPPQQKKVPQWVWWVLGGIVIGGVGVSGKVFVDMQQTSVKNSASVTIAPTLIPTGEQQEIVSTEATGDTVYQSQCGFTMTVQKDWKSMESVYDAMKTPKEERPALMANADESCGYFTAPDYVFSQGAGSVPWKGTWVEISRTKKGVKMPDGTIITTLGAYYAFEYAKERSGSENPQKPLTLGAYKGIEVIAPVGFQDAGVVFLFEQGDFIYKVTASVVKESAFKDGQYAMITSMKFSGSTPTKAASFVLPSLGVTYAPR